MNLKKRDNKIGHFYQNIHGWFDFERIYASAVNDFPSGSHFIEIGSFLGKSSAYMGVEINNSNKNIKFDCVDHWVGSEEHNDKTEWDFDFDVNQLYEKFLENISPVRHIINPIRKPSLEAVLEHNDNSVDFIYVDAAHDYDNVLADLRAWYPKLKSNGVIAGHDFPHPPVCMAVKDFFGDREVSVYGQTWLVNNTGKDLSW